MTTTELPQAPSAGAGAVDAENPWPGLEAFREEDERFFRGRASEAMELQRLVHRERLSVLFGPSGLGKSSLLQAGLFPRVRQELLLPVHLRLAYDDEAPTLRTQVLVALLAEADRHGIERPPISPTETLWEFFHREQHAFWTDDNRQVIPLLVFDQFEEAFTRGRETRERALHTEAFLTELGDLIEGRPDPDLKQRLDDGTVDPRAFVYNSHAYKVLLVIREDFLAELESLKQAIPSVMSNRMQLKPLRGDLALLVTEAGGPGLVPPPKPGGGPGVGEQIARLVAGEPEDSTMPLEELVVDPSLLSLFCRELNERRKRLGQASITADLVEGSRDQILDEFYTSKIQDLDPSVRRFVEEELLTITGHRNSEDLGNALAQPGVTSEALDTLIARRLLRREERDRRVRIELTHDVLSRPVSKSRDLRRAEEAAELTAREERAAAERLKAEASAHLKRERERAAQFERERDIQARAARKFRRVAIVAGVFCLLAIVLASIALRAEASASIAERKALVSQDSLTRRTKELQSTVASLVTTRDSLRGKEAEARRMSDSLDMANGALQQTVTSLEEARDSVDAASLNAMVQAEAADHYLRLTGGMQTRQRTQDSIWDAFGARFANVETARAAAERRLEESSRRLQVFSSVLCGAGEAKPETPQADTTAIRRVRTLIDAELASARLGTRLCPTEAPPPPRPGGGP